MGALKGALNPKRFKPRTAPLANTRSCEAPRDFTPERGSIRVPFRVPLQGTIGLYNRVPVKGYYRVLEWSPG